MLRLIRDSYKLFFKNLPLIVLFALPLLVLSALDIYFGSYTPVNRGIVYFAYAALLLIPLVSAGTDISIYRRLFHFNIINPLSSLRAFILYLLVQIGVGLVGTAPIFLFQYLFNLLGLTPLLSLSLAVVVNLFIGFVFMARFNIILPLIIQNKIPPLHEFLSYTRRPFKQWLSVAALVYLPYVILHYLSAPCPYTNMIVTTIFMFVFICFNIVYVNNNRLSRISYTEVMEVATIKTASITEDKPMKEKEKNVKTPKKEKEAEKKPVKKAKKATSKPKTAPKKLKPALGKA